MTAIDLYLTVFSAIQEIKESGICIKIERCDQDINPDEHVELEWEMLPIELWCNVQFRVKTDSDCTVVNAYRNRLFSDGIYFDGGSGLGCIEWNIDWSLHSKDYYDKKKCRNSLN